MNYNDARERAVKTVSMMTTDEKASQMLASSVSIDRLGIPAYDWWNEALHGVARAGLSTVFPQSIGLAATFNKDMLHKIGRVVGEEGRYKNLIARSEGDRDIYKGLTFWSPNINIVRDPRWGRAHESYGEDPFLNSELGISFVKGAQEYEDGKEGLQAAMCAKHFAVHSGPEEIRHGFNAEVSEKDLRETYLPAFERLVKEAKVAGVMSAYNAINGVPSSCNHYLLKDILRDEWGFKGYTVSDCRAIANISEFHHYKDTRLEGAAEAAKNGCELNCGKAYALLLQAVQEGLLEEKYLDEAVTDLLTIRNMLDMDDAVSHEEGKEALLAWTKKRKEWKKLNEKAAEESMVLLKNDGILPLKDPKTIAVVGPNNASITVLEGNYHGTAESYTTVTEGLKKEFPDAEFYVSQGSHLYRKQVEMCSDIGDDRVAEACAFARHADVTICVVGLDPSIEGELGDASNEYGAGDKKDLFLPASQQKMLEEVCKVTDKVIVVLLSGGALELGSCRDKVNAILQGWYPGSEGGKAIAGVLSGRVDPTGRLPETFYYNDQVTWDFTDYSLQGKTYRYFEGKPLYPFGFGLSYHYLNIEKAAFTEDKKAVKVTLSNPGSVTVSMPIQIYAHVEEEDAVTPLRQLIGIEKAELKAGETKEILVPVCELFTMVYEEDGTRRETTGKVTYYAGDHQPDERSEELMKQAGRENAGFWF